MAVEATGLRRDLGLLDAVGIGLGAIIGAGIFVVTGVAAGMAGPAFLVGLLLAGLLATANALSSAQLAASYPLAGGTYEYGYRVLSPWAGFAAGWMFLASKIAAAGTVAIGLAGYLNALVRAAPPRAVAVSAVVAFTALNVLGIRRSSRVNLAIVTLSVGSLLLLVIAGASHFRVENLRPFAPAGVSGILASAALLFFAYTGYARIATLAEEVSEPRVTIPRAIILTIGIALLLYAAVALVAVGAIGAAAMAETAAPLERAARAVSPAVATVISIGALAAMMGVILSQLLGLSRVVFAMSRRGDLPAALADVSRRGVPARAVITVGAVAALVAATGTLAGVAAAASFTILVYYAITNVAALRMPASGKLWPDAVPWAGLGGCVLLALSLPGRVIVTGVVILVAGLLWHAFRRRAPSSAGLVGLAMIAFSALHASGQTIRGTAVDHESGLAITGAVVHLLRDGDRPLGQIVTDSIGEFRIRAWQAGRYRLRVERIGYRTVLTDALTLDAGETITIRISMSVQPVPLGVVTVEARSRETLTQMGLEAFHERMRWGRLLGLGRCIGPEEIERQPGAAVSDLLRAVDGVRVVPNPSCPGRYIITTIRSAPRLRRGGGGGDAPRCGSDAAPAGFCAVRVYINGAPVRVDWSQGVDMLLGGRPLAAIEVYRGVSELPGEFAGGDARCGVVSLWTRRF